jgi:chromosome condensin MukBEF ATPase and DNA-binding subunit MukB
MITNNQSAELQLQLVVEDKIIAFYRLDDGVRLLPIEELNIALEQQTVALEQQRELTVQETQRADQAAQKVQELEAQIALYQSRLGEQ